jgi:TolA-binding protein
MCRGSLLLGLGVLGLALLVGTSESQEKKGKTKGQLPPGFKELNLTPTQTEKIYEVNKDYKAKIDELNKRINELKGEHTKAQFAVLTEEQRQQYFRNKTGEDAKKDKAPEKDKKSGDSK